MSPGSRRGLAITPLPICALCFPPPRAHEHNTQFPHVRKFQKRVLLLLLMPIACCLMPFLAVPPSVPSVCSRGECSDRLNYGRLPLRTAPPTAIAALMSTRFLMMYCPSSVGAQGMCVKHTSGSSTSGRKVPGI